MSKTINPAQQPCRTCKAYDGKLFCKAIEGYVQSGWTGCIRWELKDKESKT